MKYMKPLSLFQVLPKSNILERGRLLGLDVGDKYVGLAVSDFQNQIASPLRVLLRKKTNIDLMATDFQTLGFAADIFLATPKIKCLASTSGLISELSLSGFIFGYPFTRQRSSSPDAIQVKIFIEELCNTGKLEGLRYTFWDECFTSKNVELLLKDLNLHPVQSKTIVDKFAAVGILQGYLDFANKTTKMK